MMSGCCFEILLQLIRKIQEIHKTNPQKKSFTDNTAVKSLKHERTGDLLVVLIPVQPLLVELDDNLGDLNVGLLGWNQISLV